MKYSDLSSYHFFQKMIKIKEFKDIDKKDTVFIKKYLNKNDILLDIGCGWGRELLSLHSCCKKIIGIDYDKIEISVAKDFLKSIKNIQLILSDARNLKIDTNSISKAICLFNTLGNNIEHLNIILKEIYRVLNNDGIFMGVFYKKIKNKKRFNCYLDAGLEPDYIKNDNLYFKDGFYSKGFIKSEIINYFKKANFKTIVIKNLTDISYFVVAYKK